MSGKHCFICDFLVEDDYHLLCTYKFQSSNQMLVEKLASMLNKKMVLICRPSDVICVTCVRTMETIHRLDNSAAASKKIILEYLDKKYSCGGDLLKTKDVAPDVPPNVITGASFHKTENGEEKIALFNPEPSPKRELTFAELKKKSEERMAALNEEISNDIRSKVLLECNKCHYSTNYIQFEKRHLMHKNQLQNLAQVNVEQLDEVPLVTSEVEPVEGEVTVAIMSDILEEENNIKADAKTQDTACKSELLGNTNFQVIEISDDMVYAHVDDNEGFEDVQVVWQEEETA